VQLHEALCAMLVQPARIRVQVAYGDSYVDVDPDTGRPLRASSDRQERPLFEYLEAVAGGPLPRGIPMPLPPF
jgi:hypothetical protein